MNTNRKVHITISTVGLIISILLLVVGMFKLPPTTTAETQILHNAIWIIGAVLLIVFTIYLVVSIVNKEKRHSTLKVLCKYCFFTAVTIGALSLIVGGIITAIDFVPLGSGMIIGGIVLLAICIDLLVESTEGANKFISRLSIGIGTLIAIAIISVFLLI